MKTVEKPKEEVKKKEKKVKDEYEEKSIWTRYPLMWGIFALMFIGITIFTYYANYKITHITEYSNNGYEIIFDQIGEPMFLGPNKIRVKLRKSRKEEIEEYIFLVHNNGKAVMEENITVNWMEEYAEVHIKGEEEKEHTHNMYYEKYGNQNLNANI